jgi:uroporphyrin-III C-methyltransferase
LNGRAVGSGVHRGEGKVFLVGAGPGAPDLLTLRAARLLADADIVFHDALVHPETLALAARAELVAVGKRCGQHSSAQSFINSRLVEAVRHHAVVVRLKGGDPLVFGRAQEEIDALAAHGLVCEVVPGVTAALGAAADLGVSLTRRGLSRSLALVTPRIGVDEDAGRGWLDCARHADTVAIYMARDDAPAIADALIGAGRSPATPVVVVVNATLFSERAAVGTTLGRLAEAAREHLAGPGLILVGEVLAEWVAASDPTTATQVAGAEP